MRTREWIATRPHPIAYIQSTAALARTPDINLLPEPMRQNRSFVPPCPALRQINRLGWTKTPGKTFAVLAGFCACRSRGTARSAVWDETDVGFRSFAVAACWLLRRGAGRQTGHSQVMILREPRLHFRRKRIEPTKRGTKPNLNFPLLLMQRCFAHGVCLWPGCSPCRRCGHNYTDVQIYRSGSCLWAGHLVLFNETIVVHHEPQSS